MNEKQQEKLLKILSMIDGASTDGETAAAMTRAMALLDGSEMTLSEFRDQFGGDADENPERVKIRVQESALYIKAKRNERWHWSAVQAVCNVCGLNAVYRDCAGAYIETNDVFDFDSPRYSKFVVVGTDDALVAASRLLDHIVNNAYPNSIKEYRDSMSYQMLPDGQSKRIHSKDFRLGFYMVLRERSEEAKKTRDRISRKRIEHEWSGDTSLVRATDIIRQRTARLVEAKAQEITSRTKLRKSYTSARPQSGGFEAGKQAGSAVNLSKPSGQRHLS